MRLLEGFSSTNLSTEEIIIMMVEDSISFQEIGKLLGVDRKYVGRLVAEAKLNLITPQGQDIRYEDGKMICKICSKRVLPTRMPKRLHEEQEIYALSYCFSCKDVAPEENPLEDKSLAKRLARKEKACRGENKLTLQQIPYGYFSFLFLKQEGKCFYSADSLAFHERAQLKETLSIDRVLFDGNYEQGNIVLAANRFNNMKSDMTMDEMKKWSPKLYERAAYFLANKNDFMVSI